MTAWRFSIVQLVGAGRLTFVFRVRLFTVPDLMTRSNSKLPFWLTGDRTPRFVWFVRMCSTCDWSEGGVIFMPVGRIVIGSEAAGCAFSAMVGSVYECYAYKWQLRDGR